MNAATFLPMTIVTLACLCLFPVIAWGGEGGSFNLQANIALDFVADRARMIQVSIVVVTLGCALMWWRK